MKALKLAKLSNYLFCFVATALLLAMTPVIAMANGAQITTVDGGFPPCDIGCFAPDGESTPIDVQSTTINVGDVVQWTHAAANVHYVVADSTMGDYQGHTCSEPGGLFAILVTHENIYQHQFTVPGDCYYRCTNHPPGTGYPGYPGMQGVIHVLPLNGSTTTTTTTTTSTSTTTTTMNHPPTAVGVVPLNVTSGPSIPQSFTATYSDPDGWQNIAAVSFSITANGKDGHNQGVFYNKTLNRFTLLGAGGNCNPGQMATISSLYLSLNCSASSISGSGNTLTMTFSLTPQPIFPGPHPLSITVADQTGAGNSKNNVGKWTVHRSKD